MNEVRKRKERGNIKEYRRLKEVVKRMLRGSEKIVNEEKGGKMVEKL